MKPERSAAIFAERMKFFLRRSKVKQLYLATLLEVTPSAISQMLKCRILMSNKQFNIVAKGLGLSEAEALDMQILLSNVRYGETPIRSPFNRFMKSCRREKKLSISRLAQMSGISTVRIKAFENDCNAIFTLEDAQKLSPIFGRSAEFLMDKVPEIQNIVYARPVNPPDADAEVADNSSRNYNPDARIPIVPMEDFKNYSSNVDLFTFGNMRSADEMRYFIEKKVIGIRGRVKDFQLSVDGDIIFFVTDKSPLTYVCSLFLCLDTSKKFHILRKTEKSDGFYSIDENGEKINFSDKIRWALAIIDIKIVADLLV